MNEVDTQFLLESAESLREKLHDAQSKLAYTAPEQISAAARQWMATTERMIDLFEAAVAAPLDPLVPKVVAVARALMHDYTKDFEE